MPLLALMFAVLKGLGVQHRLEPVLLSRLSLDQETTDLIIGYIDRTNVSTLGTLGAAALVLTVISVLGTIEASFNHIWRVAQQRSLWRKVTDYLGVVLLTPFLLLAGVAITSAAQVQQLLHWVLDNGYLGGAAMRRSRLSPLVINAAGIGVLYAVMPNRRPAWGPIVLERAGRRRRLAPGAVELRQPAGRRGAQQRHLRRAGAAPGDAGVAVRELDDRPRRRRARRRAGVRCGGAGGGRAAPGSAGGRAARAGARRRRLRARRGRGSNRSPSRASSASISTRYSRAVAAVQELGWLAALDGQPGRFVIARAAETIDLEGLAALADAGHRAASL